MTTSERLHAGLIDAHVQRLIARAKPEQIRRLLRDIQASGDDSRPPAQGTA